MTSDLYVVYVSEFIFITYTLLYTSKIVLFGMSKINIVQFSGIISVDLMYTQLAVFVSYTAKP